MRRMAAVSSSPRTAPACNFVRNVGLGEDATHTNSDRSHPLRVEPQGELTFPLTHPTDRAPNEAYKRHLLHFHRGRYVQRIREWLFIVLDYFKPRRPQDS